MSESSLIVREPLLDPKQRVIGFQFSWQRDQNVTQVGQQDLNRLLEFIANKLMDDDGVCLLGNSLIYFEATPEILSAEGLKRLPPRNTVLILHKRHFLSDENLAVIKQLRDAGFGICLRGAEVTTLERSYISHITHLEVKLNTANFASQAKVYAALKQSAIRMVASQITTWADFDASAALGLDCFVGKLHLTPRQGSTAKAVNSSQSTILQLMEMVRNNADISQIELVVKRDAGLAYKLLRYINSAGFGLRTEIQSLKHAVQMLGYSPLYRWLTLLLATASNSGYSPVLLETAIVRGRFAELLGQTALSKSDAENLFVAGMFSLLDRLIGLPMEELLASIQLPEVVRQALLGREGPLGPYLALAEACELNSTLAGALAEGVKIPTSEVNTQHIAALVWAKNVATLAA